MSSCSCKVKANDCKGLVFDNPNSSTARYMKELAGIEELPKEGFIL
jgi:phosphate transport system substrate-binding protein